MLILQSFIIVLHPRHKLRYFEQAGWEEDWVSAAKDIVCNEFNRSYASRDVSESGDEVDQSLQVSQSFTVFIDFYINILFRRVVLYHQLTFLTAFQPYRRLDHPVCVTN